MFPPFMRGYTHRTASRDRFRAVSPVHAGIYLSSITYAVLTLCFPRSCGDIPHQFNELALFRRFPPFMRGYTQFILDIFHIVVVSPVHAGIYPFQTMNRL